MKKSHLYDFLYNIAGSILYAAGIDTFAGAAGFAPGGVSGLALILNHLWGLPVGIMTLVLNVPLVLISYKAVGKKFLLKTAVTMLISTFFLDLVFPFFHCTADSVCWQQFIQESCWAEEWCCSICVVRPLEESIF